MGDLPYIENQDTDDWDTLVMGSAIWPGVPVVDVECERDLDVKVTSGSDGATLTDKGYKPAQVTITLTIASREEWLDLLAKLPTIHPRRKGGTREPVAIEHPATLSVGVTQIYIQKITAPKVDRKTKLITIVFHAIEWLPKPKPANGVGAGGASQKQLQDILDRQRKEWEQQEAYQVGAQTAYEESNNPAAQPGTAGGAIELGINQGSSL